MTYHAIVELVLTFTNTKDDSELFPFKKYALEALDVLIWTDPQDTSGLKKKKTCSILLLA